MRSQISNALLATAAIALPTIFAPQIMFNFEQNMSAIEHIQIRQ
jgi:hypothetical protein